MTLIDTVHFPPGGYAYRDDSIKLVIPPGSELASMGLSAVAQAVQTARANNPWSGLDPSWDACLQAVKDYQCARFKNNPDLLTAFCGEKPVLPAGARPSTGGCASCGR